ncbi:MAG: hypothetical protein A3B68_02095 [Candidatus Melainabacteria bacterium RIFCSPHIGHO2_02_FULL_34_12]|nr:MAG: hypothetical protein A3B68_02095 [Candidatus Melainabacteria bacterium RIFCSPHIGHO2_02_FULL_34_12]
MKNNIYFLIRSLLVSLFFFLLLPFHSFAQSLAPIPDVGEGVCVANCPGTTSPSFPIETPTPTPTPDFTSCPNDCSFNGICEDGICNCFEGQEGDDCSIPKSTPTPITQSHLESAKELNMQALQELNEGKYVEAKGTIDDTIESLNNAKDNLRTDPIILEFCEGKPNEINKIERSIQSSINNHEKAASVVDRIIDIQQDSVSTRINNNPNANEEGLLQKLINTAKKYLKRRPPRVSRSNVVCGVRG